MKRIYFLIIISFLLNVSLKAQEASERAKIVQMCIDLPEVQTLLPKDAEGNFTAIHIMQYPIELSTELEISKFGKSPVFMTREQIYDHQVDAYFLFQNLDHTESSAYAKFTIYYQQNSEEQKLWIVDLDFDKIDDQWVVVNTAFEKH